MTIPATFMAYSMAGRYGAARRDMSLAALSKWRIGGPCDLVVEPENQHQIEAFLRDASDASVPFIVVGGGSNLFFSDAGFAGACLRVGPRFSTVRIDDGAVSAQAGAWVPGLVRRAAAQGLTGLEHMIGIPGTIGGLVIMNGGSQRRSVSEHVVSVRSVARDGTLHERSAVECGFGYRTSIFRTNDEVVLGVDFALDHAPQPEIRREMLAILRTRRRKFPLKMPNCGSVFVSDPLMYDVIGPPGQAIEDAGLKGHAVGDAVVSERHANFFVNRGAASSVDMLRLISQVQRAVQVRTGFRMRTEVLYVSANGDISPADQGREA